MLYFLMDFKESTIDARNNTGALASAVPEADPQKLRLPAPQTSINEGPPPDFQIMGSNGHVESRNAKCNK